MPPRLHSLIRPSFRVNLVPTNSLRLLHRRHATLPRPSKPHPVSGLAPIPRWRIPLFIFGTILTWVSLISFFHSNILQIMTITGNSMYPFLNTDYNSSTLKDRVLVKMWLPARDLHRGMVVAFWAPSDPEKLVIKRIVALEGDRVRTKAPYPFPLADVPVGHVWVEGEHPMSRERSLDSNYYGPVSKSLIVGKAIGVVWPWERRGWIRWEDYRGSPRVMEGVNKVEQWQFF